MTDVNGSEQDAKDQAAKYVVEETNSSWSGSPEETVKEKLQEGLDQAGVDAAEGKVDELADQIHSGENPSGDDVAK